MPASNKIAIEDAVYCLRHVAFASTAFEPTLQTRTAVLTVHDFDDQRGNPSNASTQAHTAVAVQPTNDEPPVLSLGVAADAHLTYTEVSQALGDPARFLPVLPSVVVSDVDAGAGFLLSAAVVELVGGVRDGASEALSFGGVSDTRVVLGMASVSDMQDLLRQVTYVNMEQEPSRGVRTVEVHVFDGEFNSNTLSVSVDVATINDRAAMLSVGSNAAVFQTTFTENSPGVPVVSPNLAFSDADNDAYALQRVTVCINERSVGLPGTQRLFAAASWT